MCKLFDDWSTPIKEYCEKNGLNFKGMEKLIKHLVSTGMEKEAAIKHINNLIEDGSFDEVVSIFRGK